MARKREMHNAIVGALLACVSKAAGGGEAGEQAVEQVLESAGVNWVSANVDVLAGWSSSEEMGRLFSAARKVSGDPHIARRAGEEILLHQQSTEVLAMLRSLGGVGQVMRFVSEMAAKLDATSVHECVELGEDHAVIEVSRTTAPSRIACDYAIGVMTALPEIFGYPPAEVTETACQVEGDRSCRFEVRWVNEPSPDPQARIRFLEGLEPGAQRCHLALEAMATELASVDDIDEALETIALRASMAVRAPHYLLAVRLPRDETVRVHAVGLSNEEATELARQLLGTDAYHETGGNEDGSKLVVEVASRNHRFGILAALHAPRMRFVPEERRLLEAYGAHAAAALETAAALAESRAKVGTLMALLDLSGALAGSHSTGEAAHHLAGRIPQVLECEQAAVLLWQPDEKRLVLVGHSEQQVGGSVAKRSAYLHPAVAHRLAAATRPLVLRSAHRANDLSVASALAGFEGGVIMPVVARSRLLGALVVKLPATRSVSETVLSRLPGMASMASWVLDNAVLLEQIRNQELEDSKVAG